MGKERVKATEEQYEAQKHIHKGGTAEDLKVNQALMSSGPYWYNGYDGTLNADLLAGEIIDECGLIRRSGAVYNADGQRMTDDDFMQLIIAKITPLFPEDAPKKARFDVLPILKNRLNRLPDATPTDLPNDGMKEYITKHIKAEIDAFTAASEIKTGFTRFDQLAGGLYPALYVIGAISSLGKTTFVHQLADQVAASGKHVLFFSLEMSRLELATKSIARRTAQMDYANAITSLKIRRGIRSNLLAQAMAEYCQSIEDRLCVVEGGFETTVQYIREYARQYAEKHATKPVIIVDYLQILQGAQKGTLREAIDFNVVELKRLSRDLNTPVIVISSVNRSNYLLPVDFESFKESGGIEYTADVVLGMQLACLDEAIFCDDKKVKEKRERIKAAKGANPREVKLVCLKNRYGPLDWTVDYKYYPRYDLFEEQDGFTVVNEDLPFDT